MTDLSYTEAVEAARGPVLLGPAPCSICGAWTEYAGGAWVALGSDELHDCTPYMGGHTPVDRPAVLHARLGDFVGPLPALARYQQAHELPEPEPAWVGAMWGPLALLAALFVLALVVEVVARYT